MICHSRRSTKTISKPDTLTSDFKKFPSNLFDLWKCVQVHREWFQIYHILVRIINDFQFVNLSLPCSPELHGNHWRWVAGSVLCSWSMITLSKYCYVQLTFHLFSTPAEASFLSTVLYTFFKKYLKKNPTQTAEHSLCHCLANLLQLDIRLLVPSSWHVHFWGPTVSTCQMDVADRQLYIAIFLSVDEKRSHHHHFSKIASSVLMFALMSHWCISTTILLPLNVHAHSN